MAFRTQELTVLVGIVALAVTCFIDVLHLTMVTVTGSIITFCLNGIDTTIFVFDEEFITPTITFSVCANQNVTTFFIKIMIFRFVLIIF